MVTLLRELIIAVYKTKDPSFRHEKYNKSWTICLTDLEKFSVMISHKSNFVEFCRK